MSLTSLRSLTSFTSYFSIDSDANVECGFEYWGEIWDEYWEDGCWDWCRCDWFCDCCWDNWNERTWGIECCCCWISLSLCSLSRCCWFCLCCIKVFWRIVYGSAPSRFLSAESRSRPLSKSLSFSRSLCLEGQTLVYLSLESRSSVSYRALGSNIWEFRSSIFLESCRIGRFGILNGILKGASLECKQWNGLTNSN